MTTVRIQKATESGGLVESTWAPPLDRAVAGDQRRGVSIAHHRQVGDRAVSGGRRLELVCSDDHVQQIPSLNTWRTVGDVFAAESARALLVVVARIDAVKAREMLDDGVLFVDVLPEAIFVQEHLPGAISLPLATMTPVAVDRAAADGLRHDEPVIVYCFDQHCDLSARACRRFEQLGFAKVHDLIGGRAAWTVLGYPTEGQVGDRRRVSAHVLDAPRVHIGATVSDVLAAQTDHRPVAVIDDEGVLLGAVHETAAGLPPTTAVADILVPAPGTVRVDQRVDDVLAQLRKDHLHHAFVTNADGKLVGLVVPDEIHV